jgi:uncharacterized repeat protein (TIGR03803 family)
MQRTKSSFALNVLKGAAMVIVLLSALGAFAGTESVLWNFGSVYADANSPACNGTVFDAKGNLYGASVSGGLYNAGVVFELSPDGQGGWTETLIHSFDPYSATIEDGYGPCGSLAIDAKGNLYGTTQRGGTNGGGTVWELSPPAEGGTTWTETIVYSFGAAGSGDGYNPFAGVTLDSSAAITLYGTTECGGSGPALQTWACSSGDGTVYQLSYTKPTKKISGGWKETVLYSFAVSSSTDGALPQGALALKGKNLYGVTLLGGSGAYCLSQGYSCGIAYELQPGADGWTENILYNFGATATDAAGPAYMTPVFADKNIYGTTPTGGYGPDGFNCGCGTVWELAYSSTTGTYTERVLYSFDSQPQDGLDPYWQIVPGKKANTWYGTTSGGGSVDGTEGTIFELTYSAKEGWQETNVYEFTGGNDGGVPGYNQLIRDTSGNLYGMTWLGGDSGSSGGVVFEFQP